jgi:serine/threonine protein phosphatase PrpC
VFMHDDARVNVPPWFAMSPFLGPGDAPPPSVQVEASFGARSQRGWGHSVNRDHYLVVHVGRYQETVMTSLPDGEIPDRFAEHGYGMAIADGMGSAGEAASRLALSTLVHLAIYFGKSHVRIDEPVAEEMMDRAFRFYRSIDSTLLQAGSGQHLGLRSALTVVYSAGQELFFAHVGSSRAYMFRDQQLLQLTPDDAADDAAGRAAAAVGTATKAQAPRKLVTETLGGPRGGTAQIAVERVGLLDGDVVVLATQSLTELLDDAQIADVLRQVQDPEQQSRELVDLAIRGGAKDDVTVLVARYRIPA